MFSGPISFQGEELFYAVTVITLKFNRISFHGSTTGEFSFHKLGKFFEINISRVESFDDGHFFPVPAFVHFHIDPLLFLCYLLTDTQFPGKSTRRANATNHYSYF